MRSKLSIVQPMPCLTKWLKLHPKRLYYNLQLIKSKCSPALLYGLEACVLNNVEYKSVDFTAKRFFMKFFRTVSSEIITDCQTFFSIDSPSIRLAKLTVQFIVKYKILTIISVNYSNSKQCIVVVYVNIILKLF